MKNAHAVLKYITSSCHIPDQHTVEIFCLWVDFVVLSGFFTIHLDSNAPPIDIRF